MSIDEIALQILNKHWKREVPVNVEEIAKSMGIDVYYLPTLFGGEDISGRFDMVNNVPTCFIRSTDNEQRKRFTLAHEIGHYALGHGGGFKDNSTSFNVNNGNVFETQANQFALSLLMPKIAIDYAIEKTELNTIDDFATAFNVSESAAKLRLNELGILPQ